jgi:hypothetical protein
MFQKSRRQTVDMKQVPYWGLTNISRHSTKFGRPGYRDLYTPGPNFARGVYCCDFCGSQNIISPYSVNWLVFITETECLLRGTNWVLKCDSP